MVRAIYDLKALGQKLHEHMTYTKEAMLIKPQALCKVNIRVHLYGYCWCLL